MKTIPHADPLRRSNTRILVPLLWLCAGIALGFALRSVFQGDSPAPAPSAPAQDQAGIPRAVPHSTKEATASPALIPPLEQLRKLTEASGLMDFAGIALVIQQLEISECRKALQLLRRLPAGDEQRTMLSVLAGRWAKLNPYEAFSLAQTQLRDNEWRNRLGLAAGAALAASDPNAALERIHSIKNRGLRHKASEWIIPELVKTQPKVVTEFLKSNPSDTTYSGFYHTIAHNFGKTSPQEAIQWAESLPEKDRAGIVRAAWLGWISKDPVAAVATIQAENKLMDDDVHRAIATAWSAKDPFAAIAWAESISDKRNRAEALGSITVDLDTHGTEGALRIIRAISDTERQANLAAGVAEQITREQDVASAVAFVESLPENLRLNALDPIINQWAGADPTGAARYVAAMPESKKAAEYLGNSIHNWAQLDPEAAFAYVNELPAGLNRDKAVSAAVRVMREENPQKALEWFDQVQDKDTRSHLARELVRSLVKTDRQGALALVEEIAPQAQPDAYRDLVRGWAFDQPTAAGEWVNSLPAGPGRDAAVKAYVSVIDGMDPASATKWAQSIADPFERVGASVQAFVRWKQKDEAAARAWIENAPATEREFYDRILNDPKYAKGFD